MTGVRAENWLMSILEAEFQQWTGMAQTHCSPPTADGVWLCIFRGGGYCQSGPSWSLGGFSLGGFTDPFKNLLKVLSPYPGKVCIHTNQCKFQGFIPTTQAQTWIPHEDPLILCDLHI